MSMAPSDPVLTQKAALLRETLNDLAKPPFTGCRSTAKWTARVLSLPLILTFSIVMVQAVFSGALDAHGYDAVGDAMSTNLKKKPC
jgi:hypothetical protein